MTSQNALLLSHFKIIQGVQKFSRQQAVRKKQAAMHDAAKSNSMWQLLRDQDISHQEILIIT